MKIFFMFILSATTTLFAQYNIPFASTNNAIELAVSNTSTVTTSNVVVTVSNAPAWLKFTEKEQKVSKISSHSATTSRFTFSVDKTAPVNKPEQVTFTIANANGEKWTKTLSLQVSPPDKFELYQNYPNPFNPTTVISYQLPAISNVSLKIYDALGREVITLEDGLKEPGYHQNEWNAVNFASGMYIYQLVMATTDGKEESYRKKMLLLR
ncbi:MAG: T9SS type A sorting domain-containing protein [Bacteroidota bacterium]|nr:T9SS type A sorting domain-containing protein [Bacteroidota bacterium]